MSTDSKTKIQLHTTCPYCGSPKVLLIEDRTTLRTFSLKELFADAGGTTAVVDGNSTLGETTLRWFFRCDSCSISWRMPALSHVESAESLVSEEHQITLRAIRQPVSSRILLEWDDGPFGTGIALQVARTLVASESRIPVEEVTASPDGSSERLRRSLGDYSGKLTLNPDKTFSIVFTPYPKEVDSCPK